MIGVELQHQVKKNQIWGVLKGYFQAFSRLILTKYNDSTIFLTVFAITSGAEGWKYIK